MSSNTHGCELIMLEEVYFPTIFNLGHFFKLTNKNKPDCFIFHLRNKVNKHGVYFWNKNIYFIIVKVNMN